MTARPSRTIRANRSGNSARATQYKGATLDFSERFQEIRTGFERPFWVANVSELFERLSYYAVFASLARYLHEGLHFDVERASSLTGMFGGWVWFLAVIGGAVADRLGFRRALSLAYLFFSSRISFWAQSARLVCAIQQRGAAGAACRFMLMLPAWASRW